MKKVTTQVVWVGTKRRGMEKKEIEPRRHEEHEGIHRDISKGL